MGPFHLLNKQEAYLTYRLTRSIFLSKDKNSFLGIFWHMLNPLLLTLVLFTVFTYKFHMQIENYGFYILLGITHFNFFSNLTSDCAKSLLDNKRMVLSSVISREIVVMTAALNAFVNFLIEITIVFGMMIIFGLKMHWAILFFPVVVGAQLMFGLGIGFFLAASAVFFKDLLYLWGVFLRALFFITPIFYSLGKMGGTLANDLLRLNPLSQILISARDTLLYGTIPNIAHLILLVAVAFVVLMGGWIVFKLFEPYVADRVL